MLRQFHGITRQLRKASMVCLNQVKTVLYHGKISTNNTQDMANMNFKMVLTHEAKMALFEGNKERGWPSPS